MSKKPKKLITLNEKTKNMLNELQKDLQENQSVIIRTAISEYYRKKKRKGK